MCDKTENYIHHHDVIFILRFVAKFVATISCKMSIHDDTIIMISVKSVSGYCHRYLASISNKKSSQIKNQKKNSNAALSVNILLMNNTSNDLLYLLYVSVDLKKNHSHFLRNTLCTKFILYLISRNSINPYNHIMCLLCYLFWVKVWINGV